MGHLINPTLYRLGKTKFWKNVWAYKTKKNYKNYFLEDLNIHKFINWLFSVLNWSNIGFFLSNFNLLKTFKTLNLSIFLFFKKTNSRISSKKSFYKFKVNNFFIRFFNFILFRKRLIKKRLKKKYFKNKNVFKKKKIRYKKILKYFLKQQKFSKKKKYKKSSLWLSFFFFRFCKNFLHNNNNHKYLNFYKKKFSSYFLFKNIFKKNTMFIFFLKKNLRLNSFLYKKLKKKSFDYAFFFKFLSFFLSFFLNKIFKHKNFIFNFFQKSILYSNSNLLKEIIKFNIYKNKNKVTFAVKKIFKKTKKKITILGIKIGFFGRYEKKLRNKKVWQMRGSLSPSNINSVLSHTNFCILLKQGLCGVKISFLNKFKKNEIFKKKTFTNKTFRF